MRCKHRNLVRVMVVAALAAGVLVTSPSRPASAAQYQPIPGLECIRYGERDDVLPPNDPNVTALCLYEQWRRGTYYPEIPISGDDVMAKIMAIPFRPMWFAGCTYAPPNDVDLINGGHYCRFADSTGYLDLVLAHISSGPVIVEVVLQSLTTCPSAADFSPTSSRAQPTVFRPGNGFWYVNAHAPGGVSFGAPGDVPCAADFDPDGVDDLTVFRPSNGNWYVRRHAPGGIPFGGPGDMAVTADYSGDGIADIAVFRPSEGRWYVRGLWPAGVQFGLSSDMPAPRDYDGDGRTDVAVYRPTTGEFFIRPSSGGSVRQVGVGQQSPNNWAPTRGSLPAPADYDGDGAADCGVLDRDTGFYRIDFGCDGSEDRRYTGWATPGYDEPTPADYDGDGMDEPAVFDWNHGSWKLGEVSNGYHFGNPGDLGVP